MSSMAATFFLFALLSGWAVGLGLQNYAANTPPMGFNPFNAFGCNTNESNYREAAAALVKLGLKDLGYKYLNMDCGWQSDKRTSSGEITWNQTRIPSGMGVLGNYIHGLGLRFGVYSSAGTYSCSLDDGLEHWLGSKGHEQSDAYMFTAWGADYLKYGNCFVVNPTTFIEFYPSKEDVDEELIFGAMRDGLNTTGRPVVYSISEWGIQDVTQWGAFAANSWTITNNVGPSFTDLRRAINALVSISKYGSPNGWNDLDLLQVGNEGMTVTEWKTQFAFWAAAKSPLLISTDLTKISPEALEILKNKKLIAINQDSLGMPLGFKRRYTDRYDVWNCYLSDGTMIALLLSWQNVAQTITFHLPDVELNYGELTDVWNGTSIGPINGSVTVDLEPHGTAIYQISNGQPSGGHNWTFHRATDGSNIRSGGATLRDLGGGNGVATNIGMGGELTFTGMDAGPVGGSKVMTLWYINSDVTYNNSVPCPNCSRAQVSVNGGPPVWVEVPISGVMKDWNWLYEGFQFSLDGFVPGPNNKVKFGNPNERIFEIYQFGIESAVDSVV